MVKRAQDDFPQVIAVAQASRKGTVTLKKHVRAHLGNGEALYFDLAPEVLLSACATAGSQAAALAGTRLQLSDEVWGRLDLGEEALVAMIQREGGVALKRLAIEERPAGRAQAVDVLEHHVPQLFARVTFEPFAP